MLNHLNYIITRTSYLIVIQEAIFKIEYIFYCYYEILIRYTSHFFF